MNRNEFLFAFAARIIRNNNAAPRYYEGSEIRARRHHAIALDLIESIRAIEARLHAGEAFLGYTLWSESQEARDMRRADPERHERAVDVWIDLLGAYERKIDELAKYGVRYEYCPPFDPLDRPCWYLCSD